MGQPIVQDHVITSLIEKRAKLNELSEPQMEAVREAIAESIELGSKIGIADAVIQTAASFNKITQKLILARTLIASMTALLVGLALSYRISTPGFLIICTGIANTSMFYVIDLFAMALRWLVTRSKSNDSTGSSTNNSSGEA